MGPFCVFRVFASSTTSFTDNSLTIKTPSFSFQGQALYKISKNWTSQTIVSTSNSKTDGYYQYLWDSANGDEFTRYTSKANRNTYAIDVQQNFQGDFNQFRFNEPVSFNEHQDEDDEEDDDDWVRFDKYVCYHYLLDDYWELIEEPIQDTNNERMPKQGDKVQVRRIHWDEGDWDLELYSLVCLYKNKVIVEDKGWSLRRYDEWRFPPQEEVTLSDGKTYIVVDEYGKKILKLKK